ncbi:tetratricopeptide repeat protein, partial [Candidatus Omnitrophota bacterium]
VWQNDFTLWFDTAEALPESHRVHFNLGQAYYKLNLLDEAIAEYNKSLQLLPSSFDYEVLVAAGHTYLKKGLIDAAIKAFKMAVTISPEKVTAYDSLAIAYGEKGDYEEAIRLSIEVLEKEPGRIPTLYFLAINYAKAGLVDEAIDAYEEYLKLDPYYASSYVDLGHLYYKKSDYQKAKSCWLKALDMFKDYQPAKDALKLLED